MRVALVHDYLTQFGGAERVLTALMELFPNAPVFTLLHDSETFEIDERRVRTSFLQNIPGARRYHRYFPLLMPLAVEQWDFSGFDLVLSDTHSFTKGVVTSENTKHISYCFTPMRYSWDDSHRYVREFARAGWQRGLVPPALSYLRLWDYYASQRVDRYITLSDYVARRIEKYYRRQADVIMPPVDVDRFFVSSREKEYYLVVSRLVPYKRVDLAIKACERLGRKLKIAGVGPEEATLRKRASRNTTFLGFVPDEDLPDLYAGAKALLFPQEEDFGITPLEAAASGRPTIAYGYGGARETIVPLRTGLFFDTQDVEGLKAAILQSERIDWDSEAIRQHASLFSRSVFLDNMQRLIDDEMQAYE